MVKKLQKNVMLIFFFFNIKVGDLQYKVNEILGWLVFLLCHLLYNHTIYHNLMMWSTMNNGQSLSNKLTTFSLPLIVNHIIIVTKVCNDPRKKM